MLFLLTPEQHDEMANWCHSMFPFGISHLAYTTFSLRFFFNLICFYFFFFSFAVIHVGDWGEWGEEQVGVEYWFASMYVTVHSRQRIWVLKIYPFLFFFFFFQLSASIDLFFKRFSLGCQRRVWNVYLRLDDYGRQEEMLCDWHLITISYRSYAFVVNLKPSN